LLERFAGCARSRDESGDEEILLGAEQLEEIGLGDACPTGDRVRRGFRVAADGELDGGGGAMTSSRRSSAVRRVGAMGTT